MAIISLARVRVRSVRFLLPFFYVTLRLVVQARRTEGNIAIALRKTTGLTFWRLTLWRDVAAMEGFRQGDNHRRVEPKAAHWFDEFAIARWEQEGETVPGWDEASRLLQQHGRLVEVERPSPSQRAGIIETT